MGETVKIKNAVLHILDSNISMPVLSDKGLEIEGETSDFLEKHIEKLLDDSNLKNARFVGEVNVFRDLCHFLASDNNEFLQTSMDIAQKLFEIMIKNIDIPPADLICCLFDYGNRPTYGILKLNYKTGFTHYVQKEDEGCSNTIIRYKTILPSESQRIDECAFINLEDFSVKVIEKPYDINGEKEYYLSKLFLHCSTDLSDNEKLKIMDKVSQKINKKFFDNDFDKVAKMKKVVSESLEENRLIDVDSVVEEVFENNFDIQNEYMSEIKKAGLHENTISIPEKLADKKYKTLKIKTDTGIEINFPPSYYDNKEKMEFINNSDGTISIIIKNVGKITNR